MVCSTLTKYVVLYPTCCPSTFLNAGYLESRSGRDEHGQPFPVLGANQRKGHSAICLWTRYAFRSFGCLHCALYGGQFSDASFNQHAQGRWCVGGGGSPTQFGSMSMRSRVIVQALQRIRRTYSTPLKFLVNRHPPFYSCQYHSCYPAE